MRGIVYELIAYRNEPGETSIREAVVLSLLSAIFERALPLPSQGTAEGYTVRILPEDPVEFHDGRGRRPEIDYLVCLDDDAGAPPLPPRHRGEEEADGETVATVVHVRCESKYLQAVL